jgi:hypothetical protein
MKNSSPLLLQDEKETLHENIMPLTTTSLLACLLLITFHKHTKTISSLIILLKYKDKHHTYDLYFGAL